MNTNSQHRIKFLLSIFFLLLLITFGSQCAKNDSEPKSSETYFPSLGNYADLYLRGSYDVLHVIRVRELEKIGTACKIGAQRKLAGGRIISGICTPHIMGGGAGESDVPGNPNIAPEPANGWIWRGFDGKPELGAKDFLIVANPAPNVEEPHDRGCFVLGVGFPMTTNRYSPPNFNDHPDYFIEDMSDIFIYTWGPKEDGLITPTLTPT